MPKAWKDFLNIGGVTALRLPSCLVRLLPLSPVMLLKGAIVGLLAAVVGYWIELGMERHDQKLLKEFQPIYADYQELRAVLPEIVNKPVPADFKGPQTITLSEQEVIDIRAILNQDDGSPHLSQSGKARTGAS